MAKNRRPTIADALTPSILGPSGSSRKLGLWWESVVFLLAAAKWRQHIAPGVSRGKTPHCPVNREAVTAIRSAVAASRLTVSLSPKPTADAVGFVLSPPLRG